MPAFAYRLSEGLDHHREWRCGATGCDLRGECDTAWRPAGDEFTDVIRDQVRIRVGCAGCYDELRARHLAM
jgi:hypothetical protein